MAGFWKGKKLSEDHKKKLRTSHLGQIAWNKGRPWSEDEKKVLSIAHKGQHASPSTQFKAGQIGFWRGKERPELRGVNHYRWKGGSNNERDEDMGKVRYREWRRNCMERDDFRCYDCGERGKYMEVDHVYPYSTFPSQRYIPENGQTVCKPCHLDRTKLQHKRGLLKWNLRRTNQVIVG